MSDLKRTPFDAHPRIVGEISTSVNGIVVRIDVDPDGHLDTNEVADLRDYIVRAVNAHDDLSAAMNSLYSYGCKELVPSGGTLAFARAALVKAGAEP